MANPIQSLRVRIRGSATARKIVAAYCALLVAAWLVFFTVIFLAEGVTAASLVVLVPIWSLGVIAWIIIARMPAVSTSTQESIAPGWQRIFCGLLAAGGTAAVAPDVVPAVAAAHWSELAHLFGASLGVLVFAYVAVAGRLPRFLQSTKSRENGDVQP